MTTIFGGIFLFSNQCSSYHLLSVLWRSVNSKSLFYTGGWVFSTVFLNFFFHFRSRFGHFRFIAIKSIERSKYSYRCLADFFFVFFQEKFLNFVHTQFFFCDLTCDLFLKSVHFYC